MNKSNFRVLESEKERERARCDFPQNFNEESSIHTLYFLMKNSQKKMLISEILEFLTASELIPLPMSDNWHTELVFFWCMYNADIRQAPRESIGVLYRKSIMVKLVVII